ncbi:hypothetical protein [Rhodococcus sp. X156]|uniref:hypothetical protein n=1 Tax=Rhodococcus sp. X156 TaxID=2499145 RepID=UPI000FD735E0|nr:hypothetical protein [Rhodococcus sp. X156]
MADGEWLEPGEPFQHAEPFEHGELYEHSVRLLARGRADDRAPDARPAGPDRHWVALALTTAGDLAVTVFVTRGATGALQRHVQVLRRADAQWVPLGAHHAPASADALAERPPTDVLGGPVVVVESGAVAAGRGRRVRWALLRTAREVRTVVVDDRAVPVPWHGHLVLGWRGRRHPKVLVPTGSTTAELAVVRLQLGGLGRSTGR